MWFVNGLLFGILLCLALFIYANFCYRQHPSRLPEDYQKIEYREGSISFCGHPGYQDIPCRIEIYHTYRYSYNARLRVVKEHSEIRRYSLNVPIPLAMHTSGLYYRITDSDGVSSKAYIGFSNTLIQA